MRKSLDYVLQKYNSIIEPNLSLKSEFAAISGLAAKKGAKYYSVFDEIGKQLEKGIPPTIKQLFNVDKYVSIINDVL